MIYLLRLLWQNILYAEPRCSAHRCPYRRVGFSVWCRTHFDEIMVVTRRMSDQV